jgi:acetyl esterase
MTPLLRILSLVAILATSSSLLAAEKFTTREVVYKKVGDRELVMDLYEPTAKSESPRPAIVYFHGGGWGKGSRKSFEGRARRYAAMGIPCAAVEYRFISRKPNDPPVVCIQDAKSAMRWVRSHADELNIDPDKIMASGSSAGGHLSAAVTLLDGVDHPADDLSVSPKANAMVLFCPVLDNGPDGGYGHDRCGPNWRDYSPAHHVVKGAPPTLIFAGRDDQTAKLVLLDRFAKAMHDAGNPCELKVYEGGHDFASWRVNPENAKAVQKAFDKFLKEQGWLN